MQKAWREQGEQQGMQERNTSTYENKNKTKTYSMVYSGHKETPMGIIADSRWKIESNGYSQLGRVAAGHTIIYYHILQY